MTRSSSCRGAIASRPLAATLAAALFGGLLPSMGALAQDNAERPLIEFDQSHPLMPDDGVPMVQVFESGRVIVTRAAGRTRPGRYEFVIDADELQALASLAASGSMADPPRTAAPQRDVIDGREVFTVVLDAPTTSMRLRVAGGAGANTLSGDTSAPPERTIEVTGLAELAEADTRSVGTDALISLERSLMDVFEQAPVQEQKR